METSQDFPPLQTVSDPAIDDAPVEDPLVMSEPLQSNVSPSTLLNSTPHSWTWPQHPRLFLDIHAAPRQGPPTPRSQGVINASGFV